MRSVRLFNEAMEQAEYVERAVYVVQAVQPAPVQEPTAGADALAASVERTKIISTAVCAGLAIIAAVVAVGIGCAAAVMLSRRVKARGLHCMLEVSEDGRLEDKEAFTGFAAEGAGEPGRLCARKGAL